MVEIISVRFQSGGKQYYFNPDGRQFQIGDGVIVETSRGTEYGECVQANSMIDEIENKIFNMEEKEVPTSAIGELVMGKLKDLDEVAYVRFASVYREFKDVNTFIDEIGKLLKK